MESKNGIVLAMFGTSVERALGALVNIQKRVVRHFPGTDVRLAFTSNFIRRFWTKKGGDPDYRKKYPHIPEEIFQVQGPHDVIARFLDEGVESIIVQPVHIAPTDQYMDAATYMDDLDRSESGSGQPNPFTRIVFGRSALGTFGDQYPYRLDIQAAARALAADASLAQEGETALLYLGHGNNYSPTSGVYREFAEEMNNQYPGILTLMTMLEGGPSLDDVVERLHENNISQVVIKPFMVAAGKHAMEDMIGEKPESLKNRLENAGFTVIPMVRGLGEQDVFADIFVQHIQDAADDADIRLT